MTSGNGSGSNQSGALTAVGELATAIASGASTAQAQADFNAAFSGIPGALLDKAFADLAQEIEDAHVTTADLSAVATDTANLQSDQPNYDIYIGAEIPVTRTLTSGTGGSATSSVAQKAANAGATTTSASASVPSTDVVATPKHKEKTKHKAAVKVVTHVEVHRSKAISKGQEAKDRVRAADRPKLDDRTRA